MSILVEPDQGRSPKRKGPSTAGQSHRRTSDGEAVNAKAGVHRGRTEKESELGQHHPPHADTFSSHQMSTPILSQ
jgi:hypothetical protein